MSNSSEANAEYRQRVAVESARFIGVVARGRLDAAITACPEWTVRDLAEHLGDLWRWAASIMETGERESKELAAGDQVDLVDWLGEGRVAVLSAIDESVESDPCWNLWDVPDKTKAFWYRRQANETSMHRWDVELAVGLEPSSFAPAVGVDIVDEWVHAMLGRRIELGHVDVAGLNGDLHLHCTDIAGEWTMEIDQGRLVVIDEHRKSAVALRAAASDLALAVYGRGDRSGVELFGDQGLADRWLG